MTTQVNEHKRTLPPLPPVRQGWYRRIQIGPLLIIGLFAIFLCYPATLITRGLISSTYMKQGEDALSKGRWNEARNNFNAAMDWSLSNPVPFDSRWGIALRTNDVESAIADFTTIISNHPSRYMGYCYRADAYRKVGKEKEALQDYRACLAREPSNIWQHMATRSIETLSRRVK